MSKENKQLENKKAFYDDFVFKFSDAWKDIFGNKMYEK